MVNGKYFTKIFLNRLLTLTLDRPMGIYLLWKIRKFWKNAQIAWSKKLWGSVKTERSIIVKKQSHFFHLLLRDFEIKIKRGKKLNFFEFLKKYSFSWMTFVSKFFKIWFGKFWYQNRSQSIWENFPFEKKIELVLVI